MTPAITAPELIFHHARIHTMDARRPRVEALAIGAGRIEAVGRSADVLKLAARRTTVIDLRGRAMLPGMTDSHIHFYEWALNRRNLDLSTAASLEELLEQVRRAARVTSPGRWILGVGWNESDWPTRRMPLRTDLDAVAPQHPVALWRCDMHLATVNSAALAGAGIDAHTADPPGGAIERGGDGRPSGILRELAINPLRAAIPEPTEDEILLALNDGVRAAHRIGLTGVHDIRLMNDADGARALSAFQRLHAADKLDLRCWVTLPGNRLEEAIALGLRTGLGDDRLRIGHVKFFSDGGMGARTAWMLAPYLDAPGCGLPQMDPEVLFRRVSMAQKAGLAVMVHAVGDRATREVIGVFERLGRGPRATSTVPHRIEHVQMIDPADCGRLAALPVAVSATPYNLILDINMIDACVGPRGRWAYAYRDLLNTGRPVMFSSDAPVCAPDPLLGIKAAVTRTRADGTPSGGWYPESRLSVDEALQAYTAVPARVHGLGERLGRIAPGMRADLVVLDQDPLAVDPESLDRLRVDFTLFDGRIVYARES